MTAQGLAALLHRWTCHTVGDPLMGDHPCNSANGGEHARRRIPEARAILASQNPAAAIHDRICDAHIHFEAHGRLIPDIRCGDRAGHIEAVRAAVRFDA